MGNKKHNVYTIRSAFNSVDVQVDRDLTMDESRLKLLDFAAELDYWDGWHISQKKKYKEVVE